MSTFADEFYVEQVSETHFAVWYPTYEPYGLFTKDDLEGVLRGMIPTLVGV